jgi:hypothetical protein
VADPELEAYRRATAAIAVATARVAALSLRQLYERERPGPSFMAWLDRIAPLVRSSSLREAALARAEYARLVPGPVEFQAAEVVPEAFRRSMFATAFETLQDVERTPATAMRRAATEVEGATVRHVLKGARDSTVATVKADARVLGAMYVNHPDGKACYFCKLLATRGPCFKGNSFDFSDRLFTGGGTAKCHDSCRCVLVPVTSADIDRLADSRIEYEKWLDVTKGFSGTDKLKRWRQSVENRLPVE